MRLSRERARERGFALANRAAALQSRGDAVRPEKLYARALVTLEAALGADDPELAPTLCNFGLFRKSRGELDEARRLYERALPLMERSLGAAHADVGTLLYNLAQLLKAQAAAFEERSRAIERDAEEARSPRARPSVRQDLARYRLAVKPSRVHRFGLFAAEAIPARARVIEYTGERVSRREAVRRWNADRTYLLRLDSYWRLDGAVGGSGAELVNHSCAPNCRFSIEGHRAWIAALRPIRRGEELFLDYSFPRDSERIPCRCGAAVCRGTINAR